MKLVFVGTAEDSEPWMDGVGINLCGKTNMEQFLGVLSHAKVVVGVDNGPTAISAAQNVPTIVLFGPSSKVKNRKAGRRVLNLSADHIQCRPCQFNPGQWTACRRARCMEAIPPEQVAECVLREVGQCQSAT